MDYIFGKNDALGIETLRTKGSAHTDLTGFQTLVREFEDSTIKDVFFVVEKTKSDSDSEGNCYDWYTIDKHTQTIDRGKGLQRQLDAVIVNALEGTT